MRRQVIAYQVECFDGIEIETQNTCIFYIALAQTSLHPLFNVFSQVRPHLEMTFLATLVVIRVPSDRPPEHSIEEYRARVLPQRRGGNVYTKPSDKPGACKGYYGE